jgi:signal transduction histidine kinase
MSSSFALTAPRSLAGTGYDPPLAQPAPAWRLSGATAARWAVVVAVLMSTQYLVQPFVWKYWPVDEVLLGWLEVLRDRVAVALAIACALVLVTRAPARSPSSRAILIAAAIPCGAVAGELAVLAIGLPGERTDPTSVFGGVAQWTGLALCVAGMYFLWVRNNEARAAARTSELQRSTAEALLVQAQLQSLRQQIEPHFLFNTLATIRRLKETEPADGERLLRHLIDYLRSTMPASQHRTTLGDEVDLVGSYLAIVAIRMSGQLTFDFDVPPELRAHECPPLTLATLVENAVKHGITPAPAGGSIFVRARRVEGVLEIVVADTGVGITTSQEACMGGSGIGLANVRARLRALYGGAASLSITGNVPHGARAVIRLPFGGGTPQP